MNLHELNQEIFELYLEAAMAVSEVRRAELAAKVAKLEAEYEAKEKAMYQSQVFEPDFRIPDDVYLGDPDPMDMDEGCWGDSALPF